MQINKLYDIERTNILNRYIVHPNEDFQPGSSKILKNYLETCDSIVISQKETEALQLTYEYYAQNLTNEDPITPKIIKEMHKKWLHQIYPFAGTYRTVSMSKDGFPFAAPGNIEQLMETFGKSELKLYTPCRLKDIKKLALALAIVHVEFILIHPFRDGNGRISRMISYIMGLQAGYPPFNFASIEDKNNIDHSKYIEAIHLGMGKDYSAMQSIFKRILIESKLKD